MKILPVFSGLCGVAALVCFSTCEKMETTEPFSLDVAKGQRLKLKAVSGEKGDPVSEFEKLLLSIPPDDRKGTFVNLRREDGKEEEGPTADNKFVPASPPIGPDGSMHNTQKIRVQSQAE